MKSLILVGVVLFLSGCDTAANTCKKRGYKGMVIPKNDIIMYDSSCSNGDLSPNKKHYMTNDGTAFIDRYIYLEFPKEK